MGAKGRRNGAAVVPENPATVHLAGQRLASPWGIDREKNAKIKVRTSICQAIRAKEIGADIVTAFFFRVGIIPWFRRCVLVGVLSRIVTVRIGVGMLMTASVTALVGMGSTAAVLVGLHLPQVAKDLVLG